MTHFDTVREALEESLRWAEHHAADLMIAEHNRRWFATEAERIRTALKDTK